LSDPLRANARGSDDRPQACASDIAFKLPGADLGSVIGLMPGRHRWIAPFASLFAARRSDGWWWSAT